MPHTPDQAEKAIEGLLGRMYTRLELDAGGISGLPAVPFRVDESLDARQLATVRLLTTTLAEYFSAHETLSRVVEGRRDRLCDVAANGEITMVAQPIKRLATGTTVGVEALARFPTLDQGPAEVFTEAWHVGVGLELELAAVEAAIDLLDKIPDDVYLSVNVAPVTLAAARFLDRVTSLPSGRLVAEVTEHAIIDDYASVASAGRRLREAGVRFAVDDVGSGFAGLERIIRTNPDILKVDKSLVRDIDTSPARHAMVGALAVVAAEVSASLVAEGIETSAELAALCGLGVDYGQGFHLARPHHLHRAAQAAQR